MKSLVLIRYLQKNKHQGQSLLNNCHGKVSNYHQTYKKITIKLTHKDLRSQCRYMFNILVMWLLDYAQ